MRLAILFPMMAGAAVAIQASLTSAAQRTLGPVVLVVISGLTTSLVALAISLFLARPEFTARAVGYAVASGVLGALILGSIAFAAGQDGVARALSLVIGTQLVAGLLVDRIGLFGAGAGEIGALTVLGVLLIFTGGVLVVRY